jgi:alginate O-acetyltransferase complex protein AlgI
MLFNSFSYFVFFPVVFALYWASPRALKKPVLLIASYVFYMSWIPIYGLMVAALSLVNYAIGILLEKTRKSGSLSQTSAVTAEKMSARTRAVLALGLVVNLGCLIYFKYVNFLFKTLVDAVNLIGGSLHIQFDQLHATAFDIILPLGVSFFIFEFIHYLVDVAKGEKAIRNPIDFALFAAFFPSQIAGPIKRFENFIDQIGTAPGNAASAVKFRSTDMQAGIALILQGLFKKVAIADNLAIFANAAFNPAVHLGAGDTWIGVLAFSLQIYFDFSGYTDMGQGSAMMLGIRLPDNFNFPYFANSISDFWRRWHISLSTWLRDYVYIPLGGGRSHKTRNLLLTMLLGGLWHGAALHYVVWGGFHGCLLVLNNWYDETVKKNTLLTAIHAHPAGKVLSVLLTFALVSIGLIFFRAGTIPQALHMMQTMFVGTAPILTTPILSTMLTRSPIVVALAIYCCYASLFSLPKFAQQKQLQMQPLSLLGWCARIPLYAAVAAAAIGFAPLQPSSFIYFQF